MIRSPICGWAVPGRNSRIGNGPLLPRRRARSRELSTVTGMRDIGQLQDSGTAAAGRNHPPHQAFLGKHRHCQFDAPIGADVDQSRLDEGATQIGDDLSRSPQVRAGDQGNQQVAQGMVLGARPKSPPACHASNLRLSFRRRTFSVSRASKWPARSAACLAGGAGWLTSRKTGAPDHSLAPKQR